MDATGRIRIRRPFLEDFPTILDISNWATRHTAANFRTEPDTLDHWVDLWQDTAERYPWLVAERNGTVVGFAMASQFQGRCGFACAAEISVYVDPKSVGMGVGQALYRELIPALKAQGFRTVIAVIADSNPASERLHEKLGFRKAGMLQRVGWKLGRWHDVGYWQLILHDDEGEPQPIKRVAAVGFPAGPGRSFE